MRVLGARRPGPASKTGYIPTEMSGDETETHVEPKSRKKVTAARPTKKKAPAARAKANGPALEDSVESSDDTEEYERPEGRFWVPIRDPSDNFLMYVLLIIDVDFETLLLQDHDDYVQSSGDEKIFKFIKAKTAQHLRWFADQVNQAAMLLNADKVRRWIFCRTLSSWTLQERRRRKKNWKDLLRMSAMLSTRNSPKINVTLSLQTETKGLRLMMSLTRPK